MPNLSICPCCNTSFNPGVTGLLGLLATNYHVIALFQHFGGGLNDTANPNAIKVGVQVCLVCFTEADVDYVAEKLKAEACQ